MNGESAPLLEGESEDKPTKDALAANWLERETVETKDEQFVISKAKPIDNTPEKAQENQKKKMLKVVGVDDRYIAENYYQSTSMDELMYEKDGTISKMK